MRWRSAARAESTDPCQQPSASRSTWPAGPSCNASPSSYGSAASPSVRSTAGPCPCPFGTPCVELRPKAGEMSPGKWSPSCPPTGSAAPVDLASAKFDLGSSPARVQIPDGRAPPDRLELVALLGRGHLVRHDPYRDRPSGRCRSADAMAGAPARRLHGVVRSGDGAEPHGSQPIHDQRPCWTRLKPVDQPRLAPRHVSQPFPSTAGWLPGRAGGPPARDRRSPRT